MTGLRTKWGCDLKFLKQEFGYDLLAEHQAYANHLVSEQKAMLENQQLVLTQAGKLLADGIAAELFTDIK